MQRVYTYGIQVLLSQIEFHVLVPNAFNFLLVMLLLLTLRLFGFAVQALWMYRHGWEARRLLISVARPPWSGTLPVCIVALAWNV